MIPGTRAIRKITRAITFYARLQEAGKRGIVFERPNFIYLDRLDETSVVVDVGCGHDADFSMHFIEKYGSRAIALDPTKKHEPSLRSLAQRSNGRFQHIGIAVASTGGTLTFHESCDNESGSILDGHANVQADQVNSYDVEAVTLRCIPPRIGSPQVDLIKLDLEGAEYELLNNASEQDLAPYAQIFVEFHHHCVQDYSLRDTQQTVEALRAKGLQSFSLDNHNYLFYRN